MADNNRDIEAMRQMVGAALQQMGKDLEGFHKKAQEASGTAGGFKTLDGIFVSMAKNLAGPVGLAAGFYAASKSLEGFAANRIQLQLLSTDVGFTTRNISSLKLAMGDMGIAGQTATGYITSLGGQLKQLQALGPGSPLMQQLIRMGEGEFAAKLKATVDNGDFDQALRMMQDKMQHMSQAARTYFAVNVLGIPESVFLNLKSFQDKTGEAFEGAYQHSEDYLRKMNRFKLSWSNLWDEMKDKYITFWADADKRREEFEKFVGVSPTTKEPITNKDINENHPWLKKLDEWFGFDSNKSGAFQLLPKAGASFPPAAATPPAAEKGATFDERFGFSSNPNEYNKFGSIKQMIAAGLTKYQSGVDWLNEGTSVPGMTDPKKSLLYKLHENIKPPDIESVLDQMMPFNPLLFLKHAAQQFTRGEQSNFADRFSAVWGGNSTDIASRQKTDDLITIEKDSSKTLMDIRDILMGNGAGSTGGNVISGAGGGRASLGRRLGIGAGSSGGGFNDPGDAGVGEAGPNAYLAKQRAEIFSQIDKDSELKKEVAATLGHEGNTKQGRGTLEAMVNRMAYIRSIQPNNPRGWSVRAELDSGFFGPRNRHEVGPATDAQLKSYDWAAAQVRAGSNTIDMRTDQGTWGSEVQQGVAGGTNVAGEGYAHWPAHGNWGPAQAWTRKQRELLDAARGKIDQSQSPSFQNKDANMSAVIDFRNMPSWVKSSVDSNGVFKDLKVTRSTPQAGKAGSGIDSSNTWSYE